MYKVYRAAYLLLMLFFLLLCTAEAKTDVITQLTLAIENAKTDTEKFQLHIFRAKNYINNKKYEMAKNDFDAALKYNPQGWMYLERAHLFIKLENYAQAKSDAISAKKLNQALGIQADKIIKFVRKKEESVNPPTIELTSTYKRVSRDSTKSTDKRNWENIIHDPDDPEPNSWRYCKSEDKRKDIMEKHEIHKIKHRMFKGELLVRGFVKKGCLCKKLKITIKTKLKPTDQTANATAIINYEGLSGGFTAKDATFKLSHASRRARIGHWSHFEVLDKKAECLD